ncbi:hypothetical protein CsSME_00053249 [Camellia sinensis var. sinensis]
MVLLLICILLMFMIYSFCERNFVAFVVNSPAVSKSGIVESLLSWLPRSHLRQVHNEFHENALQVGTRLIELLLQTAYIQPRADQLADGPPDVRPAFVHPLKTVVKEKNIDRRYGVIECDPLVRKGLERTLGATAVNLVAREKPADVYSGIAARVLDIMRKDAQKDPEVFLDALCARLLINQVGVAFTKHLIHLYSCTGGSNDLRQHLEVEAHNGQVNDLAFAYPNKQLCVVTCRDDKLIKVWDLTG